MARWTKREIVRRRWDATHVPQDGDHDLRAEWEDCADELDRVMRELEIIKRSHGSRSSIRAAQQRVDALEARCARIHDRWDATRPPGSRVESVQSIAQLIGQLSSLVEAKKKKEPPPPTIYPVEKTAQLAAAILLNMGRKPAAFKGAISVKTLFDKDYPDEYKVMATGSSDGIFNTIMIHGNAAKGTYRMDFVLPVQATADDPDYEYYASMDPFQGNDPMPQPEEYPSKALFQQALKEYRRDWNATMLMIALRKKAGLVLRNHRGSKFRKVAKRKFDGEKHKWGNV